MSFPIKRNDTAPSWRANLYAGSAVVDLSGATAKFIMTPEDSDTPTIASGTCTIDASNVVTYAWQAGDTDTSGRYKCEVEVTFFDGTKRTWPQKGYELVEITDDLG